MQVRMVAKIRQKYSGRLLFNSLRFIAWVLGILGFGSLLTSLTFLVSNIFIFFLSAWYFIPVLV